MSGPFETRVFEGRIKLRINKLILMAITPEPKVEDTTIAQARLLGLDGIQCTVLTNDRYIADRMMGMPFNTGDAQEDGISARRLYVAEMTPNDAVEIWGLTQEIRFVNAKDILFCFNSLEGYITEITTRWKYSPNGYGVPKEDLEKMGSLLDALRDMANFMMTYEHDASAFGRLMSMATRGGLVRKIENREGIEFYFSKRNQNKLVAEPVELKATLTRDMAPAPTGAYSFKSHL